MWVCKYPIAILHCILGILEKHPEVKWLDRGVILCLIISGTSILSFIVALLFYTCTNSATEFQGLHIAVNIQYFLFFSRNHSNECEQVPLSLVDEVTGCFVLQYNRYTPFLHSMDGVILDSQGWVQRMHLIESSPQRYRPRFKW